jgi:hypothetical protein
MVTTHWRTDWTSYLIALDDEFGEFCAWRELHLCFWPGPCRQQDVGKEKKTTQAVKTTPHINYGKRATLVPSTVKLLHREKERKNQWGSGGLQAWPETGSW